MLEPGHYPLWRGTRPQGAEREADLAEAKHELSGSVGKTATTRVDTKGDTRALLQRTIEVDGRSTAVTVYPSNTRFVQMQAGM